MPLFIDHFPAIGFGTVFEQIRAKFSCFSSCYGQCSKTRAHEIDKVEWLNKFTHTQKTLHSTFIRSCSLFFLFQNPTTDLSVHLSGMALMLTRSFQKPTGHVFISQFPIIRLTLLFISFKWVASVLLLLCCQSNFNNPAWRSQFWNKFEAVLESKALDKRYIETKNLQLVTFHTRKMLTSVRKVDDI